MSEGGADQSDHLGRATEAALWDALWQRRTRLVAMARRRGLSLPDAEDAASEAIVRAAAYADLDHERLDEFLATALKRIVVDVLRRRCHLRDRLALLSCACDVETASADEGEGEVISRLTLQALARRARLSRLERDILELTMIGLRH